VRLQGGEDPQDCLSSKVIFNKRALEILGAVDALEGGYLVERDLHNKPLYGS